MTKGWAPDKTGAFFYVQDVRYAAGAGRARAARVRLARPTDIQLSPRSHVRYAAGAGRARAARYGKNDTPLYKISLKQVAPTHKSGEAFLNV